MSKRMLALIVIVAALGIVLVGSLLGLISYEAIIVNIVMFIFWLAVVAALAIIGAIFIGMLITHKILGSEDFTPFEVEMLAMREDVKKIINAVEELKASVARLENQIKFIYESENKNSK